MAVPRGVRPCFVQGACPSNSVLFGAAPRGLGMRIKGRRHLFGVAVFAMVVAACGSDPAEETAQVRGDRAFARGDYDEALAEYRLSILQENPGTMGHVRAAHAYAVLGRVDEAAAHYQSAVEEDSTFADQAVADLVALAGQFNESGDGFGVASAIEAAVTFRPGLVVENLTLPLARHYSTSGEYGRALPLYLRALGSHRDELDVVYETALAHEEMGDCETALVFFEEHFELAPRSSRSQTGWYIGRCSHTLALELRAEGMDEEALVHLERTIELGEPRTLLPQTYFEKGDILARMGQCDDAIEAFRTVPLVDPSGGGPLARRARDRIDEIRFGRGDREGIGC